MGTIVTPILYSTGTKLAYRIAQKYYNNVHFVWCTTSFDAVLQPGTSNPRTLCNRYLDQIIRGDLHAKEIDNNKAGILKGANEKYNAGVISSDQYNDIRSIVACADMDSFFPIIYLIHKPAAKKRCLPVDKAEAASKYSIEYKIEDLKREEFDIIVMEDVLHGVVSIQGLY